MTQISKIESREFSFVPFAPLESLETLFSREKKQEISLSKSLKKLAEPKERHGPFLRFRRESLALTFCASRINGNAFFHGQKQRNFSF